MHRFANPTRFLKLARPLTWICFWSGLALVLGACIWGLAAAPADRLMGDTVRILYIHVPTAWLGMGGWVAIALASNPKLIMMDERASACCPDRSGAARPGVPGGCGTGG